MSLNIKKGLAGAVITALAAGAIALTAAAPATAAEGDRIQGPFVTQTSLLVTQNQWSNWNQTDASDRVVAGDHIVRGTTTTPPTFSTPPETWTFPAIGTTGPIMNSSGKCIDVSGPIQYAYVQHEVTLEDCDGSTAQQFILQPNGTMLWAANTIFGISDAGGENNMGEGIAEPTLVVSAYNYPSTTDRTYRHDALRLADMTPVAEDCTVGLTGSVSNVNQTAKSAVVSGTGAAGETITIDGSPTGAVTTVVDASGNWTANVAGLATGDNTLTVTSSDNCAPVELSVIIEELEIPVAHPAAAAAAGVLGLGALLFGGIRRRNTARI